MRIKAAWLEPYALTFQRTLHTAVGPISAREGVLLHVTDEQGHHGVGDAAPLPGFSQESLAEVQAALETQLQAGSPLLTTPLTSSTAIRHFVERLAYVPAAAHALDQALLDLWSTRRGLPLCRVLSETIREQIPVHALVTDGETARFALEQGFTCLKAKVGSDFLDEDDDRVASIRQAVGAKVQLRLDANGAWADRTTALSALRRLSRYGVQSIEQPVPREHLDLLAEVRAYSPIPVAADEAVRSPADLERIIERHAADAVVIKPMLCGGLHAALAMAQRAAAVGLPVSLTTTLESCIGRLGCLQLAATLPGKLWSCGFGSIALVGQDLAVFPEANEGAIVIPVGPGQGLAPLAVAGRGR